MAIILALFAGCDNTNPNGTATINYEQLGAPVMAIKDGNSVVSAGPSAAFVLFKINNIDNRNAKVNFAYDPTKLYVTGSSPRAYISTTFELAQKIGVLGTTATTVSAGTDLPNNGYAVVAVRREIRQNPNRKPIQ